MVTRAARVFSGRRWLVVPFLVLAACNGGADNAAEPKVILQPKPAAPSPGPPTGLRLVLRLEPDGRFRLLSATPRRGSVDEPAKAENRPALLAGDLRMVEYTAKDAKGATLVTGFFVVPMTAVAEYQDPENEAGLRSTEERLTTPTVRASIPYRPDIATITFQGLEPNPAAEPREWKRVPMGEAALAK